MRRGQTEPVPNDVSIMYRSCIKPPAEESPLLSKKLCRSLFGFFFGLLLQLLIDAPDMSERIADLSITRAPEHVGQRHDHFRSARDCPLDNSVGVIGRERNAHSRTAERLGRPALAAFFRGEFVADEQQMAIEL